MQLQAYVKHLRCRIRRKRSHLLGIAQLRDLLCVGAVIHVSFIDQRKQEQIEPEVVPLRMDIGMHGHLFDRCPIAYCLKIHILRKIILVQAVRNELVAHKSRTIPNLLDGADIGFISRHQTNIPVFSVLFHFDGNNTSHYINTINKCLKIHIPDTVLFDLNPTVGSL